MALAAAADAFGIFSGERPDALFRDAYMSAHGGLLGEAQWAVLSPFIGRVGVDVLVVALIVAGVLLVTGSSLRQWATHSRQGVAKAGRAARSQAEAMGARRKEAAGTRVVELDESPTIDASDLMRTSVRPAATPDLDFSRPAPAAAPHLIDGVSEAPDIFGEPTPLPDEPSPEPVVAADDGVQLSLAAAAAAAAEKGERAATGVALAFAEAERRQWALPDPAILRRLAQTAGESPDAVARVSERLVATLQSFNIPSQVIGTVSGPRVTRYELQLEPGIKVSKVAGLKDDLKYALAATDVRVLAPIPGKTAVGVEVPNIQANYVSLGDIHGLFPQHASPMAFWLGKDVTGKAVLADLRADGPPAHRRHHRLRQERLPQRAHHLDPAARHAGPGAHDHDRPQEGRAQQLQRRAAPAGAGGHQHEAGHLRARQHLPRDGPPLRRPLAQRLPGHPRAQQEAGARRRGRHAVHDGDHRRAGRPHDGGPVGGRGLHHPPRPARAAAAASTWWWPPSARRSTSSRA